MGFIHVHTKFQLSSFIRSGDIADLLLGVFFSKMPFFQKNAVFIYKSKGYISASDKAKELKFGVHMYKMHIF